MLNCQQEQEQEHEEISHRPYSELSQATSSGGTSSPCDSIMPVTDRYDPYGSFRFITNDHSISTPYLRSADNLYQQEELDAQTYNPLFQAQGCDSSERLDHSFCQRTGEVPEDDYFFIGEDIDSVDNDNVSMFSESDDEFLISLGDDEWHGLEIFHEDDDWGENIFERFPSFGVMTKALLGAATLTTIYFACKSGYQPAITPWETWPEKPDISQDYRQRGTAPIIFSNQRYCPKKSCLHQHSL